MDSRENLLIALHQTENIMSLMKGNEWENYLFPKLSSVKYELERQLHNTMVDKSQRP